MLMKSAIFSKVEIDLKRILVFSTKKGCLMTAFQLEVASGFEPLYKVLQTFA